jgi:hypothetical protein
MAQRSPRKRVRGQPLRGFKSPPPPPLACKNTGLDSRKAGASWPLGLIWRSQLRAACGPIAGLGRSCRAWSRPSRTTLNTSTHAAESCTWRFTEPAALPRPGISAMPVRAAAGSAAARRLPFLRRRRRGAVDDLGAAPRGRGEPPTAPGTAPVGWRPDYARGGRSPCECHLRVPHDPIAERGRLADHDSARARPIWLSSSADSVQSWRRITGRSVAPVPAGACRCSARAEPGDGVRCVRRPAAGGR